MRRALVLAGLCALLLGEASAAPPTIPLKLNLPLAFEPQEDPLKERYIARGQGYMIGIDGTHTTIGVLPVPDQARAGASRRVGAMPPAAARVRSAGSVVSMEFAGGRHVLPVPSAELPGKVNYIRGNDPRQWKLGVPTHGKVMYQDVYPGVDVVYYGNQQQLEFDLVLKPGADHRAIRMKFDGARKVSLDAAGQLVLDTPAGKIHLPLSRVHQETGGPQSAKRSIEGHYVLRSGNEVGFEIAAYDRSRPLVIDPTIQYGALFGGNNYSVGNAIALDSSGNIFLTGYTSASDFPATAGAAQPGYDARLDGFVTKVNSSGTALIYSTYLGGAQDDYLEGIAVDSTGAAWVAGYTSSVDFPMMNPYQGTFSGSYDVVLAKLSSTGALQFSTYLGGGDTAVGYGVAVDASNNAYATGYTSDSFPTTPGVLLASASGDHGFVAKFNSAGSIVYSTLLGGDSTDVAYAVAADGSGNAYVTGYTYSSDFTGDPGGGARTTSAGGGDAFIAKLNSTGTALVYFTFLGGSGDDGGQTIALDASSPPHAYVGGYTSSTDLTPTAGVVGASLSGGYDGFVARLNASGSAFSYITYLGGTRSDSIYSLAVEPSTRDVYVTGYTESTNFPRSSAIEAFLSNPTSLFQTTSGTSWSAFDGNIPALVNMLSPDLLTSGTLVASTDSGIYRTTNGGSTWTLQSSFSTGAGAGISRSLASPGTIYAVGNGDVYLSADDGVTWNYTSYVGTYADTIIADPLSSGTAYSFYSSSLGGLYKTIDTGATWTLLSSTGLPSDDFIVAMVVAPDGTLYAALSSSGIYKSTNQAAAWTAINTGLPSPLYLSSGQILTVSPGGSGNILYLTDGNTVYKTTNGGASWAPAAGLVPNGAFSVASSPSNANLVYAAATYGSPALYLSSDGGTSWSAAATGLGSASINGVVFNPFSSTGAFALATVIDSAFIAKLNATATAFVYSTYLGGSSYTEGYGIATNGIGEAFVTGYSDAGFPIASTLPAPANSSGVFLIGITDAGASCSYSVNPTTQTIQGSQTVSYTVNAPSGCSWTAVSNQSWATVVSGASGTGVGFVTVQTTDNNTGSTRSASLTINTGGATLNQASSSCVYSLNSHNVSLTNSGGPEQVNVTTGAGCPWTVVNNNPSAITVTSGGPGSGNGTVNFTVLPSAALNSRSLSLTVAGRYFSITQGGVCVFSLNSTSLIATKAAGNNSVGLTASALGCSWTASSDAAWLTITAGFSGSGSSTVSYSFQTNTGTARSAALTIGGQTFTVNQQATPTPTNRTFVSTTGSDANNCTANAYCRTFAAALALTNPGGEIVVVNSGGYGPVVISQPVVITAIDIDASITATSGNALTINTTGNVTITGLNLNGGGTGNDGIVVQAVGFLRLYNMQIQSFANDGIEFNAAGNLAIYDSKVNDSLGEAGLLVNNASAQAYVHNSSFDHNNGFGVEATLGTVSVENSSAQNNSVGFDADRGTIVLDHDVAMFNDFGLDVGPLGTLSFANCLISENTTAWIVNSGGTITDTNPGTSLVTPEQGSSGFTSATALQ